jgi:hypothetical protein
LTKTFFEKLVISTPTSSIIIGFSSNSHIIII